MDRTGPRGSEEALLRRAGWNERDLSDARQGGFVVENEGRNAVVKAMPTVETDMRARRSRRLGDREPLVGRRFRRRVSSGSDQRDMAMTVLEQARWTAQAPVLQVRA